MWQADGTGLFYVDHTQHLQRVAVTPSAVPGLVLGRPVSVAVPAFNERHWGTAYEVTADGGRVFLPQAPGAEAPAEMTVVLGWRALLGVR